MLRWWGENSFLRTGDANDDEFYQEVLREWQTLGSTTPSLSISINFVLASSWDGDGPVGDARVDRAAVDRDIFW